MQPQLQAQLGILFDREARDARTRRDIIEAGRLESIAEHLWETSGFDDDPFVDRGPITFRKTLGAVDHVGIVLHGPTWMTADPPLQPVPPPPPRPAIPWGPVKPPAPAPKPQPAGPPCPKC